ncbi:methylenetetrahydrofolate--tRNA-(uracil(54)-C(5))-methyltransferase (FADH(2)-oxidizing) TrmFO [Desulfallas gibsoniae]|uniref:Methylenetetrahydrofolate--tRNA-(uracil-5-)-methyltransferase TrmFO n=1 Tax=Desulfoscipio gibsoniae DSM 7213 TaxID=767817 RepID=R4KL65_9FIRM|nr:tRNA:m(5)U-54 methyltransferase [Desulfoscipio gibsoniae DSM 7213]
MQNPLIIIGAGLAGSEAAWQAARRGIRVHLYEMRPQKSTPAHQTGYFAELVCSNSLRARALENAVGLLKEEMRRLDSIIMQCADSHSVPAGGALAVDREDFALAVTGMLEEHPLITVYREECTDITSGVVLVASGPLTSDRLAERIREFTGQEYLYFHDAVAPIVSLESINMDKVFWSSRYGKGEDDYMNCPMNEYEYTAFQQALATAERAHRKDFDQEINFEGCMPIEVLARRGEDTMRFGPLKPVGLIDPRTGKRPYAVVQLRRDNAAGTMLNIVGFQTHLKWSEQKRVFSMIPGLEQTEFMRYGVMHRNTYINSPVLLKPTYQCKLKEDLFFGGQITGVEGYVESAASGLVAGINAALLIQGRQPVVWPAQTAHGALAHYITSADARHFQPMNITFGLFPPLAEKVRDKKKRYAMYASRALEKMEQLQALIQ